MITKILKGGWYILKNWNEADFDYKKILIQLHAKYGVSPYFKISVEPNPWSPEKYIVALSPSGLGLPDRTYYYLTEDNPVQIAYKQYVRDIVINLSVTKTEAEKFSTDMFHYEKRLAEITPDSFEQQNLVNSYTLVKLSELHYTIPMLPLHDILAELYPEAQIVEDTDILVSNLEYLMKVSQIISSTDSRTLNSYLMWTLVRDYVPYLSSSITSSLNSFNEDLLGIKNPVPRWEECAKFVNKFAGLALESRIEKDHNSTRIVNEIFQSIADVVKYHVQKEYKNMPDFHRYLSRKISGLKVQVGLPEQVLAPNYIKQYYIKLMVMRTNFLNNYKHGIEFLRKLEEKRLNSPNPEDIFVLFALFKPYTVSYIASKNTVFIPRIVLSDPVFDSGYPSSVLYGRLGVQIANAIVSSVTPFEIGWSADLKLLVPNHFVVNESLRISQGPERCFSSYFSKHKLLENEENNTNSAISLNVLKELSAVKFAHFGLINTLKKEEHIHQPALENFEDDSLFFLTYSQTHCSVLSKQRRFYMKTIEFKLPQEAMFNVITSHYSPVLESLNCPSSKTKTKCNDIF